MGKTCHLTTEADEGMTDFARIPINGKNLSPNRQVDEGVTDFTRIPIND